MRISDWSSDVCSSDLLGADAAGIERWQRAVEKLLRGSPDLSVPLVEPGPESSGEAAEQPSHDAVEVRGGEPVPGPAESAPPAGPRQLLPGSQPDRKRVGEGKRVDVRVDPGGGR